MDERKGEWGKGRQREGTGELLVMAGERERDDDHDSKTKVGTSFVRLARERGREGLLIPKLGPSRTDWTQRSVGRSSSVLRLPSSSSLTRSLGN